jgi:hypothetical protein
MKKKVDKREVCLILKITKISLCDRFIGKCTNYRQVVNIESTRIVTNLNENN